MQRLLIITFIFTPFLFMSLFGSLVHAQSNSSDTDKRRAKACYESKDRECLESIKPKVSYDNEDEGVESYDVYYYLALLVLEEGGDPEEAKKYLMVAIAFGGGHEKAKEKLADLYKNNVVKFSSAECITIESMACLTNLADNENDKNAQYLLGGRLIKENPDEAVKYLKKAAAQNHKSAKCTLANGVKDGDLNTGQTYHGAVQYLMDQCRPLPVYKKFSAKYFKKYLGASNHKAYAHSGSGWSYYRFGFVTPELAARAALESCMSANKDKELRCRVINVDGKWVKEVTPPEFQENKKGVDALLTKKAVKSFTEQYSKTDVTKVFVQSDAGVWSWKSSSSDTLEVLTKKALNSCQSSNRGLKEKFPCRVINQNGEWK